MEPSPAEHHWLKHPQPWNLFHIIHGSFFKRAVLPRQEILFEKHWKTWTNKSLCLWIQHSIVWVSYSTQQTKHIVVQPEFPGSASLKKYTIISMPTTSKILTTLNPRNCHLPCISRITYSKTTPIWAFPKIGVSPNHPILIGFSIINHPFWGTPIFGKTHIAPTRWTPFFKSKETPPNDPPCPDGFPRCESAWQ